MKNCIPSTQTCRCSTCSLLTILFALALLTGLFRTGWCADTLTVTPLGQGVYQKHYHYDNLYASQQEIFVVDADLSVAGVALKFPYLTGGATATVSTFAVNTPGAVAVTNGQFFDSLGSIQFLKLNGSIINLTRTTSVHDEQALSVDSLGAISILLKPGADWSSLTSVPNIMASGPGLIANGARVAFDPADTTFSTRHPRTCAAVTSTNHLFLVVIDGGSAIAAGQTGPEMQTTLQNLGSIVNAVNYDGGGSTTLWAGGSVVNQPSGGAERAVADAIALVAAPYAVHVQSITMSFVKSGSRYKTCAVVNVVDAAGVTVKGATVTGDFTGAISNLGLSGATNSAGAATITSTTAISAGTVTFTVKGITGSNMTYNAGANVVTSASITR